MVDSTLTFEGDRLAKVIARAGLCSRRDAELWIKDGRVAVNGKVIRTPAFNVTEKDKVKVDGQLLTQREGTRVWLYHKPPGLVVTEKDPEGRPTIFDAVAEQGLPRVVSVGRLDINTEGLLLLTNDGGLKRVLELPATGWLRRYRVRAFGTVTQQQLEQLADGIEVEGVKYGPIEAELEREQGSNVWLTLGLREGKNREVKNVLAALGLQVNRLIRISFGPFQLSDLPVGAVEVVRARVLREQLGKRLADEAEVDFDSDMPEPAATRLAKRAVNPNVRVTKPGKEPRQRRASPAARAEPFHFTDGATAHGPREAGDRPMANDRPGSRFPRRPPRAAAPVDRPSGPPRRVFNPDGTEGEFVEKTYGKKPRPAAGGDDRPVRAPRSDRGADRDEGRRPFKPRSSGDDRPPRRSFRDAPAGDNADRPRRPYAARSPAGGDASDRPFKPRAPRTGGDRPPRDFGDRPKRDFGDRPKRDFGDRPPRNFEDRPKRDFGDRPKRAFGDKPPRDSGDRPPRAFGDKPKRGSADRPGKSFGDRPPRARDAGAERPRKPYGDAPRGPRPDRGDKPFGSRPPRAGAPSGNKRPRGSGPDGDRPRRPRPPKA